jgi:hypothetical protein
MIREDGIMRTIVCKKDGCSGNEFYIVTEDGKLKLTCKDCCEVCNNDTFKVFNNLEQQGIYAKCTKCGAPPDKIYVDDEGIQVTYETKLLQDIKQLMNQIDQRICNLDLKIDGLEKGQELLEESLAYINRYMSE